MTMATAAVRNIHGQARFVDIDGTGEVETVGEVYVDYAIGTDEYVMIRVRVNPDGSTRVEIHNERDLPVEVIAGGERVYESVPF